MNDAPEHIVVLRLSALGDVAMTVPVILALKESYPGIKITVVTREVFSPIFTSISGVSVFPADVKGKHRGLAGLYRLAKDLKSLNPSAIADLHFVLRTRVVSLFLMGQGIPFAKLQKGRSQKRRLTRLKNKVFEPLKSTHQRYADVFNGLGLHVNLTKGNYVLPSVPWPKKFQKDSDDLRIGVAPFAAHSGKCYPEPLMLEVLQKLGVAIPCHLYLFGGGSTEIVKLTLWEQQYPNCEAVAGKLSLSDELAVISNLDLMISMDSGNGHLAAMFGIPVLTLWGVTHPFAGFAPYGQPESHALTADRTLFPGIPTSVYGNRMPAGYEHAIGSIPPDQVVARALQMLTLT